MADGDLACSSMTPRPIRSGPATKTTCRRRRTTPSADSHATQSWPRKITSSPHSRSGEDAAALISAFHGHQGRWACHPRAVTERCFFSSSAFALRRSFRPVATRGFAAAAAGNSPIDSDAEQPGRRRWAGVVRPLRVTLGARRATAPRRRPLASRGLGTQWGGGRCGSWRAPLIG